MAKQIEYFSGSDTMPYVRYHKFLKYLTLDAQVGSNSGDVLTRTSKAVSFLNHGDIEGARVELSNLAMLYQFILSEYNPSGLAAAVCIKSIDCVERNDLTLEGLKKTLEDSGLTTKEVVKSNEDLKKKISLELEVYFPETFSTQEIVYNSTKLSNLNARLRKILGEQNEAEISSTEHELLKITKSSYWNPRVENNLEVVTEREYQKLMIVMGEHTNRNVQELTVLEFYSLKNYIVEKNRKNG